MFGKKILILIPHPDDEAVGCCGAILRAQAQGSEIFGCYLTTGISSDRKIKRIAKRREEAKKVAALLKIQPVFFEETPSRRLKEVFDKTRARIAETIARYSIDRLWTPAYEGGHQDHDVANFLASRFREKIAVWEFGEYNFFGGKRQSNIFFQNTGEEFALKLNADEKKIKKKALSIYRSEWFNLWMVRPDPERETLRPLFIYNYQRPPYEGKMFYQRFHKFSFHPKVDSIRPEDLSFFFRRYMSFTAM